MNAADMTALEQALRREIRGVVFFDDVTRGIYSTDASNYQIKPIAVVVPQDQGDARAAVRLAAEHGVPVLPRGGGTSLAGQTVAAAVVLDFSKSLNRLIEVNVKERWARVEPGLVRDELNALVAPHGLHFAPDPATSSRANVGGMIGNNSSGTKSILHGKTIDHVLALQVLLADGSELSLGAMPAPEYRARAAAEGREGEILRGLRRIVDEHQGEIAERYPKTMRRVGGYPLDEFKGDLSDDATVWNPAKLLVGSEGTLGVTLEAKIRLEPLPRHTSLCVAHFASVLEAIRGVAPVLPLGPSAVEILDDTVLNLARENLTTAPLCEFIEGDPGAVLLIEFHGETAEEVESKAASSRAMLEKEGLGYAFPVFLDKAGQKRVWEVRKNGLGLMLGIRGDRKPLPFIEDAAVPIEVLPEYVEKVLDFCRQMEVDVPMYAHASVGVLHLRPVLDLRRQEDIDRMIRIAEHSFELVVGYEGSWSSEHGDGLVRSPFNERFFGKRLYRALQEVKALFDPRGLMNPGKITGAPPMDENLRYGTAYHAPETPTVYQRWQDGSFRSAVEVCNGVGQCRKILGGTMCPSYIATRDEEHSTRGRANALRLAMSGQFQAGQVGPDAMTDRRLHETMELCLSCKGCKAECPSNVDMAKLKSEFLQGYFDQHGTALRDRLVHKSQTMARRLSGGLAPLVNPVQKSSVFRGALSWIAGIDARRTLPSYARETFSTWWSKRPSALRQQSGAVEKPGRRARQVVLFADTYLNYHEPHVGRSAVRLLESCGYEVLLADVGCCQRPRISHGFLRDAKRDGEATLGRLDDFLRRGVPVLVCEPSCASALTDDLPDLLDDPELADRARRGIHMIDVFLAAELEAGRLDATFRSAFSKILIHGHCHQKALYGTGGMKSVLGRAPDLEMTEVDSGCCGMAGAFGYEKEHYEISRKVGEDRLFPAIRAADGETAIVACGFSCRHQIEHFLGRKAVHWVEAVAATMC